MGRDVRAVSGILQRATTVPFVRFLLFEITFANFENDILIRIFKRLQSVQNNNRPVTYPPGCACPVCVLYEGFRASRCRFEEL